MSTAIVRNSSKSDAIWSSATNYSLLLHADRRGFAWEWLRRHPPYCSAWADRRLPPTAFGLLAYENPDLSLANARPIWAGDTDPAVLASHPVPAAPRAAGDLLDIRRLADFVSVAIDEQDVEHWLLTDGRWVIRLDLHDGTLLGGPVLLQHQIQGFTNAEPKIATLRQLGALAALGQLPMSLQPREARAARWILELRTADALLNGASYQEMARAFYGNLIASERWREDNSSYRLRVQRLARVARRHLDDPLGGPWFS